MFIRRIFVVVLIFVSFSLSAQNKNPISHLGKAPLSSSCVVTDLPPDKPDSTFNLHPEPEEPGERDPRFFFHKHRLPNNSWSNYYEDLNPGGLNKTNSGDMSLGTQTKFSVYTQGTPPDNTVAISNDGKIVASINVKIGFYDSTGTHIPGSPNDINISTFINDGTISQSTLFDPRLIYDPKADRFIYVVMNGSTDATSKLIIGFSQTNNPIGTWKFYKLNGNFDGSASWFDYPNIAVNDNELIITGNLFYNNFNFNQAVILQINKNDGYTGAASLNYKSWVNITDAFGTLAISIVPATHGTSENYGPNIYLISNTPPSNTLLTFYEITNVWNSPSSQLNVKGINVDFYSTAVSDAAQKGSGRRLDVKKNRIRFAYYSNGILHYTYITPTNTTGALPAVAYGRYDIATEFNKLIYVGATGFNFAYPAIMHFSNMEPKNVTLLTYLATNSTIYPEVRAVTIDENMVPSASIVVKAGESYVAYGVGTSERWGDYTGIARKYNSIKPEVWVFGCYGEPTMHLWGNYIAQITAKQDVGPPVSTEPTSDTVYFSNNPTMRFLLLNVFTKDTASYYIKIYSVKGQFVREIHPEPQQLKPIGPKRLYTIPFDLAGLSPEEYIIKLYKNDTEYKPSKVILLAK